MLYQLRGPTIAGNPMHPSRMGWKQSRICLVLFICSMCAAHGVLAQTAAAPAGEIARLQQRIAALEQRLQKLEVRSEEGATVQAPFTVTDDDGNPVLRVSADEGAQLTFGGDTKAPAFHVRDSDDGVDMLVNGVSGRVLLSASRDGAAVIEAASKNVTFARLMADPDEGPFAQVLQGTESGDLSIDDGKPRLQLTKSKARVFTVHGGETDTTLNLVRGQGSLVMTSSQSGESKLQLNSTGGKPAIALHSADGAGALNLYDANKLALMLGRGSKGNTVLRIIGDAGADVAAVGENTQGNGGVWVNYASGESLGKIFADESGDGALQLNSASGEPAVVLDSTAGAGSLELHDTQGLAARIGKGTKANTVLRIVGQSGADVVAVGENTQGNGGVWVNYASGQPLGRIYADSDGAASIVAHNTTGNLVAAMAVGDKGVGAFQVYGPGGQVLGSMTQGQNGGMLQLNNLAGAPMVEAGNTGNVGVVRAGPIMRGSGGMLGLPGSFILGKSQ